MYIYVCHDGTHSYAVSTKDVQESDNSWYSMVESSRWLHTVSTCLHIASNIAKDIASKGKTVVMKGQ